MIAHSDLDSLDDDLIDAILTANVRGPFSMIRAFAPLLRQSGDGVQSPSRPITWPSR
jgi:3-oxoacyl-[acyl-carrier protein] reductase